MYIGTILWAVRQVGESRFVTRTPRVTKDPGSERSSLYRLNDVPVNVVSSSTCPCSANSSGTTGRPGTSPEENESSDWKTRRTTRCLGGKVDSSDLNPRQQWLGLTIPEEET